MSGGEQDERHEWKERERASLHPGKGRMLEKDAHKSV